MDERFDAIVIGAGPGGEVVAGRLLEAGKSVALVERELIGGECAYWACIPSKALLHAAAVVEAARRTPGVRPGGPDWNGAARWRDTSVRGLDDHKQRGSYEDQGATLVKGQGRITGFGEVTVGGRVLRGEHIVIATGSEAVVPDIEGLEEKDVWTNRRATTSAELPELAAVVGGGPVGCESAQYLHRFGSEVTLVEAADRLLPGEEPKVGEALERDLTDEGITVRTDTRVERAESDNGDHTVRFEHVATRDEVTVRPLPL